MKEEMGGWTEGGMERRVDEGTDGQMDRWRDKGMVEGWAGGWMKELMDEWTDG